MLFTDCLSIGEVRVCRGGIFKELNGDQKLYFYQVLGLVLLRRGCSCFLSSCQSCVSLMSSHFLLRSSFALAKSWHLVLYLCGIGVGELQEIKPQADTSPPLQGQVKRNRAGGLNIQINQFCFPLFLNQCLNFLVLTQKRTRQLVIKSCHPHDLRQPFSGDIL